MNVVTRFAPSPTGYLHIGGARTALFNYLFARHHGGKYLLRIEDTDKERSTAGAVDAITEGLEWLNLEGDDKPVYQSANAERHVEVANQLLAKGKAFRCYMTEDRLTELRAMSKTSGQKVISDWRDKPEEKAPNDLPYVLRLKMPLDGETTIKDGVQGEVTVKNETLDDLVLLRSDGSPTYMLAVVVDDHDMGITHVIRGDDHLNNAFRQIKILEAMEWHIPHYAHIPLIHGPDGAKLSKRHGALSAIAYHEMGYLPEAMCNYLLRLGWSHGDEEIISRKDAIAWFDLDGVGKSPARFDIEKLTSINAHYIKSKTPEELTRIILAGKDAPEHIVKRLHQLTPLFAKRAERLSDLHNMAKFAVTDDTPEVAEEAQSFLDDEAKARLHQLVQDLPQNEMSPEELKTWLNEWLAGHKLKMNDIGPCLRAAVTGMKKTPDIVSIISALGYNILKSRIEDNCKL
jgi:glutamyl-tRNA synthetase